MRQKHTTYLIGLVASALLVIAGCGNSQPEGGIEGTGHEYDGDIVAVGSIHGLGSVYVNGVYFETTTSKFTDINGEQTDESQFDVGMRVVVEANETGDSQKAEAIEVTYEPQIVGIVEAHTQSGENSDLISVLGKSIQIDSYTEGEITNLLSKKVAISLLDSANLRASHIRVLNASQYASDKLIGELDFDSIQISQITLGGVVVNIENARLGNDTELTDASYIVGKAVGAYDAQTNVLVADEVIFSAPTIAANQVFVIEGVVDALSNQRVRVNGYEIDISSAIVANGDFDDLIEDKLVSMTVRSTASGYATDEIHIISLGAAMAKAYVQHVDPVARKITLLDQEMTLNHFAHLKDKSSIGERYFDLGDIAVGDWVEINYLQYNAVPVISKLSRVNTQQYTYLSGTVSTYDASALAVMGVPIDTSQVSIPGEMQLGSAVSLKGEFVSGIGISAVEIRVKESDPHDDYERNNDFDHDDKPFDDKPPRRGGDRHHDDDDDRKDDHDRD